MVRFTGKVFAVSDESRELNDKDKEGNPVGTKSVHRFTNVQLLCKVAPNEKIGEKGGQFLILVSGFDLPPTFVLPKENEDWTTPPVKSYNGWNPLRLECRI